MGDPLTLLWAVMSGALAALALRGYDPWSWFDD